MLNKNVADYTDFDGRTNKKIMQAPGGASHFSIGWSNEKTDYGPERGLKKKNNYPEYNEQPPRQNSRGRQQPPSFNYNEPIRVMEERPNYEGYEPRQDNYGYPPKQQSYSVQSVGSAQNTRKIGGEYGYNQYTPEEINAYQAKGKQPQGLYQQDSLDMKLQEQMRQKNINLSRPPINQPPMSQQPEKRSCVKIHEQKSNISLGNDNYNYWKDNGDERKPSNQSTRRPYDQPTYQQPQRTSQDKQPQRNSQDKTSVRVNNPPGGRSNFTLG